MKTTALLSTAAAVLLMGAGVAAAQNSKGEARPERAPAAQQNAPAEKVAPPMHAGERKAPETTGQGASESTHPRGTTGASPSDTDRSGMDKSDMKKGDTSKSDSTKSEMNKNGAEKSGKSADKSDKSEMKSREKSEMKSDERSGTKSGAAEKRDDKASGKAATESKSTTTTGQGAAGAAKLSTEQRTKITTIINKKQVTKVEPSKLNISVRVGARVPTTVRFYPLPVEVVEVYPEWRGYDYILLANGQILVLMPRTHEIVAILSA